MSLLMTVGAREPLAAARSATFLLLLCAVAVAAWTVVESSALSGPASVVSWTVVLLLVAAAAAHRALPAERLDLMGAGMHTAVVGVLLACLLRVLTGDSSVGAHAFLTLPVLWAATHLHRGAVVLVTGTALVADAVTVFWLLPVEAALADLVSSGGVLVVVAAVLYRATEARARLVRALRREAGVDALTGLVNRRVFDEALHGTAGSGQAALVLIDVDAFKTINDVHGHPVGDEVLVHLASVLREQVRSDDAVLSRLGGDELAVLLPGCTAETATRRAEALLDAVRSAPVTLPDGQRLQLSISVGVAHLPGPADDLRTLYSAADAALYDAKRAGRDRVAVASPAEVPAGGGAAGQGVRRSAPAVG